MSLRPKEAGPSQDAAKATDPRRVCAAVRFLIVPVKSIISFAAACILVQFFAPSAGAEPGLTIVAPAEDTGHREPTKAEVKKKKKKPQAAKTAEGKDAESEKSGEGTKLGKAEAKPKDQGPIGGIFYGEIASVDISRNSIFVLPLDKHHYPRKIFYIDKYTDYFVDGEPGELDSLRIKQRVAIRYFGEPALRMADAVYVVSGEFVPDDYKPAKNKKKTKQPAKKAAEPKKKKAAPKEEDQAPPDEEEAPE